MTDSKVLILGGTAEARALATRLAADHEVITSLAGRTRAPHSLAGSVRTGGFGGAEGLATYLVQENIDVLVDATHPFAARIAANARQAADSAGVPRLVLDRPAWALPDDAAVTVVPSLDAAAAVVSGLSKRAFLTVGRDSLASFSEVTGVWFLVRLIEAPDGPLALKDYAVTTGRPPFDEDAERALIRDNAIDCVIAKNAGGAATAAKITAAVAEGLPIILIDRPPSEPGDTVTTAADAEDWIRRTLSA